MKNTLRWLWICLALLCLAGCASVQPYDGVVRPPKSQIDVYEVGRAPTRPYKVIMEYSEKGNIGNEAHAHHAFLERAKALGADAIIMKPSVLGGLNVGPFGGESEGVFSAVAVVYQ